MIQANDIYYRENAAAYTAAIRKLQQKLNGMSLLRLVTFISLVWCVYDLLQDYSPILLVLAFAQAGLFVLFINIHYGWKDKRRLLERLRFVGENELRILTGEGNAFPDGSGFLDADNYLEDLDIFGRYSLFHLLNRTTTIRGAGALAARLRQPLLEPRAIREQQDAIRTLAPQTAHRQLLTATGLLLQDAPDREVMKPHADLNTQSLREWLETDPRLLRNLPVRIAMFLLSAYNLYAFYLLFASNNYTFVLLGLVVSRGLWGIYAKYLGEQHKLIGHKHDVLDQYAGILAVFNQIDPGGSVVLQELRGHTGKAHTAIRKLSKLSSAFDQRLNLLVTLVLGNFFFYDLFCMIAVEKWKTRNRGGLLLWIDAVARVEALNALATYAFNHPENNYPEPVAETAPAPTTETARTTAETAPPITSLLIETTGLGHPLIPASRRITNDLTVGRAESLILVTGSNMSGKTTFLRTLGTGLLMAECGLPVCATSFRFTPLQLLTSLRISDSLQEQTSYFMAELKKLQKIILQLQTGAPALVLIDEILRGTNSEDKTFGSEQFIRKLLGHRCLSLFATHDLSLGEMERELPGQISNYCFESVIENNELHFDYRLQRGIARNRNASFLMQKMQII